MVNYDYYGNPDTWVDVLDNGNQCYVKIADWNPEGTAPNRKSCWGRKWADSGITQADYTAGAVFPDIDRSFCYIAMDKNAPMNKLLYTAGLITGEPDQTQIEIDPDRNVPFGFTINGFNFETSGYDLNFQIGSSNINVTNFSFAPFNFKPDYWQDYAPTISTPQATTDYQSIVNFSHGWHCSVLAFPFQQIRWVICITAARLAAGYTHADLLAATTAADFDTILSDRVTYTALEYFTLSRTFGGVTKPILEHYPYILNIRAYKLYDTFDPDTHENTTTTAMSPSTSADAAKCAVMPCPFVGTKYTKMRVVVRPGGTASSVNQQIQYMPALTIRSPVGATSTTNTRNRANSGWETAAIGGAGNCVVLSGAAASNVTSNWYSLQSVCADIGYWHSIIDGAACRTWVLVDTDYTAAEIREYARRACAYFGMYFTETYYPQGYTDKHDTDGIFLGVPDEYGITHGDYTHGADNVDASNYEWDNPVVDSPYPVPGLDETPSDPYTPYPQPDNGFGVCLSYYALQRGDYSDLLDWIYFYSDYDNALSAYTAAGRQADFNAKYPDPAAWSAHVCERAGYNAYPTNNIVSLMCFPFDLDGTDAGYQLGAWDTSLYHDHFNELADTPVLTGKKMSTGYKILDMGSMYISPVYGDFRDYKPYTALELQIPYHGTQDLDPADWIGHTVAVSVIVDYITGSSLAVIKRSDSAGNFAPAFTMPGQMGISVPITADSITGSANTFSAMSTAYQSGKIGIIGDTAAGVLGVAAGAAGAVGAAMEGKTAGAVSGALSAGQTSVQTATGVLQYGLTAKQQKFEMNHPATGKMVMGTGSPSTSFAYEYRCRLVRHYPAMLDDAGGAEFAKIYGHACNQTATIGNFDGFTMFGAVDLSGVPATPEEKTILLQMLQNGIFI